MQQIGTSPSFADHGRWVDEGKGEREGNTFLQVRKVPADKS